MSGKTHKEQFEDAVKAAAESQEKNKGGRPCYERNDKDEGALAALLSIGFPHRQIALYMNINIKTLKKYYADLFAEILPTADKTFMVENGLWYNAVHKLNVVAQIAWLRAHRKELYSDKAQSTNHDETKTEIFQELAKRLPE